MGFSSVKGNFKFENNNDHGKVRVDALVAAVTRGGRYFTLKEEQRLVAVSQAKCTLI